MPSRDSGSSNHSILPMAEGRILDVPIMVTNDNGGVILEDSIESSNSYFYYTINGTTSALKTTATTSSLVLGKLARIFVTYTD